MAPALPTIMSERRGMATRGGRERVGDDDTRRDVEGEERPRGLGDDDIPCGLEGDDIRRRSRERSSDSLHGWEPARSRTRSTNPLL
jgi:hypothetical protein